MARIPRIVGVAAIVIGLGAAARAEDEFLLTGGEIMRLIVGNTVSGEMGTPFVEHYRDDGTIVGESQDGRYAGKWALDGDRLCLEYGEPFGCFGIRLQGSAVEFLDEDDEVVGTGTLTAGGLVGE
jgi:hypothetical protein